MASLNEQRCGPPGRQSPIKSCAGNTRFLRYPESPAKAGRKEMNVEHRTSNVQVSEDSDIE